MKLKPTDKLTMVNHCLMVNGVPFIIEEPDEYLFDVKDNQLVTLFRGASYMQNYWKPEEIDGYYA